MQIVHFCIKIKKKSFICNALASQGAPLLHFNNRIHISERSNQLPYFIFFLLAKWRMRVLFKKITFICAQQICNDIIQVISNNNNECTYSPKVSILVKPNHFKFSMTLTIHVCCLAPPTLCYLTTPSADKCQTKLKWMIELQISKHISITK